MRAEAVTTGTEILLGQIVDTNLTRIAKILKEIGVDLLYKTTVGDNEQRITEVLNIALNRVDVIITSGGLGPTVDDVTRNGVANATGRKLVYNTELESEIKARFRSFGRTMTDNNKQQAYIPEGAQILKNPVGTAPCFLAEDIKGRGIIISLPGVPRELEYMLEKVVKPILIERMGGVQVFKTVVLRTCAVGESNIDYAIRDLMTHTNPTVGLAAHSGHTDVRIVAKADTMSEADALIEPIEAELRQRLGISIFGTGEETVSEVLGRLLDKQGLKLGILDTLTKGQLYEWLTDAGYGHVVTNQRTPADMTRAQQLIDHSAENDPVSFTRHMADMIAPDKGIGLAIVGPFADSSTMIGVKLADDTAHVWPAHHYQTNSHSQRWMTIQALDWVRRVLLGQLTSPVDWAEAVEI